MKQLKNIRVLGANKYELYISFAVVLAGFIQTAHLPQGYQDALIQSGALLIGLICVVNALRDTPKMHWLERAVAVVWFAILLFCTPTTLWYVAHIKGFADR